ncbi:FG-GAP-like repeat-containing protein [Streptomyces sannanensis]
MLEAFRLRARKPLVALGLITALSGLAAGLGAAATGPGSDGGAAGTQVSALAKARESGKPVEIVERRTETSEVFANPSGTLTFTEHLGPVRTRQGGKWVDIDTDLRFAEQGVVPKAAVAGLTLSDGGREPLVRLRKDQRHELALSWPGKLPKPVLDGAVATYREVFDGVDLKVAVEADGFSQVLVVKNPEAARNPDLEKIAFRLSAEGMKITGGSGKGLRAVDAKGRSVFTGAQPQGWDSAKRPRRSAMRTEVSGSTLAVVPGRKLLTGPDITYPVYIGHTLTQSLTAWMKVTSAYPDSSYWKYSGDYVAGVYTSGPTKDVHRTFLQFEASNLAGRQVVRSTLTLAQTYSTPCEDTTVELWQTGRASVETTWNRQPAWTARLDAKGCPTGTVTLDATAAASAAADSGSTLLNLGVRLPSEDLTTTTYRMFSSAVLTTEAAYAGQCFMTSGLDFKDTDSNAFPQGIDCESLDTDVLAEPYADSTVTGRLLAGSHYFVCWRSGDMNGAGNRIWYYVKGDSTANWPTWQAWGFVPADKIIGVGAEPYPGLPACNVHNVTSGISAPQDLNSDGRYDIVALESNGNLAYYPGNGNGTLADKRYLWSDGSGSQYAEVFTGDFNADGRGDIAAVEAMSNRIWWWEGDGDGGLTGARRALTDAYKHTQVDYFECMNFFTLDYDGNGRSDLGAECWDLNYEKKFARLWPGNGSGEIYPKPVQATNPHYGTYDWKPGDFDGDGRADLAAMVDGKLSWWLGNGTGSIKNGTTHGNPRPWPAAGFGTVSKVFAGDFNGDRRYDIAAVDAGGSLWWWPGDGLGGLGTPAKMSTATDWGAYKDLM